MELRLAPHQAVSLWSQPSLAIQPGPLPRVLRCRDAEFKQAKKKKKGTQQEEGEVDLDLVDEEETSCLQ